MLIGVCEGFYGKPWSTTQRQELFVRMARFGMSTYLYAPKDDYKHRLHWRKLYTQKEQAELRELITSAEKAEVDFVYAISPGLDMTFSDKKDIDTLKAKLEQVGRLGCHHFALLFDDIEAELCDEDNKIYDSVGHAQYALTNMLYMHCNQPKVFLFCPTEYCTSRASPDLDASEYLNTIGENLYKGIQIMWTGDKVVPRTMSVESLAEVKRVLRRPPVLWENLHANDYDQTRVYLGPYAGRPHAITQHIGGVLTNPNCEFHANFVAMHTLSQWSKNTVCRFPVKSASSKESTDDNSMDLETGPYSPNDALQCAVKDWIPEFYRPHLVDPGPVEDEEEEEQSSSSDIADNTLSTDSTPELSDSADDEAQDEMLDVKGATGGVHDAPMDIGSDTGSKKQTKDSKPKTVQPYKLRSKTQASSQKTVQRKPPKRKQRKRSRRQRMEELGRLDVHDLMLLCNLHYLPFEHGPRGVMFLKEASWLIENVGFLSGEGGGISDEDASEGGEKRESAKKNKERKRERSMDQAKHWCDRATNFHIAFKDVVILVDKFVNITNRELLYELYHYVSDIRSVLSLLNSYIKWNAMDRPNKQPFRGEGDPEPWTMRGGLHAEFRRLLPLEGQYDLFPLKTKQPVPQMPVIITCRPYSPEDKNAVYSVCRRTCDDGHDGSHLFPDYSDLLADDSIGGLLDAQPELCYVCEDTNDRVVGYVAACSNIQDYQHHLVNAWLPQMKAKYPKTEVDEDAEELLTPQEEAIRTFYNEPCPIPADMVADYAAFLHLRLLPPSTPLAPRNRPCDTEQDVLITGRLLACVERMLRARGVKGVHTAVHCSQAATISLYIKLGFEDKRKRKKGRKSLEELPHGENIVLLCKNL